MLDFTNPWALSIMGPGLAKKSQSRCVLWLWFRRCPLWFLCKQHFFTLLVPTCLLLALNSCSDKPSSSAPHFWLSKNVFIQLNREGGSWVRLPAFLNHPFSQLLPSPTTSVSEPVQGAVSTRTSLTGLLSPAEPSG